MFGLAPMTKSQRLCLGIIVLLLVDVIRVTSSTLLEYIYSQKDYEKAYFITYLKSSMFIFYLCGFLCWRAWWQQCRKNNSPIDQTSERINSEALSEPTFVPVKFDAESERVAIQTSNEECRQIATAPPPASSSSTPSTRSSASSQSSRGVRFNDVSEVRHLSQSSAEDALLARLSWSAYLRAEENRLKAATYLTVRQVAKLAFLFFAVFFFWNLSFAESLKATKAEVVNCLWGATGLYTVILTAVFPSSSADRFTLSKFTAVLLSTCGIVFLTLQGAVFQGAKEIPVGAVWAVCGGLLFAFYIVMLRRRAENEDKLNIPMFLGFMGLFIVLLFWPGFFLMHLTHLETFEWPDPGQWLLLLVNSFVGTVLPELLWLWGCFLTTSLIATLSITLTIPMRMVADLAFKNVKFSWMFYIGLPQVVLAFIGVTFIYHYDNWDPVLLGFRRCSKFIFRKRMFARVRELDREQSESLMGLLSDRAAES